MSICLTAYMLELEKLDSILGSSAIDQDLKERLQQYAGNQQRMFVGQDFALLVEQSAFRLLAGEFANAAHDDLILEGFEAVCAVIGVPIGVGPFAGCRFELFEECGQAGEWLAARGCPIPKVATASDIYRQMGYIRHSEMPGLLAEVTSRIDGTDDIVETEVMDAWETLEDWFTKGMDRKLDIISFQH